MKEITKKRKLNKKLIIDICWVVLFLAGFIVALFTDYHSGGLICFEKLIEKKDYFTNFLWPAMDDYVKGIMIVASVGSGLIYSESIIDREFRKKTIIVVKNITLANVCLVDTIFVIVSLLCLKSVGWTTVFFGIVAIFAIISIVLNCREYKIVDCGEDTIEDIWKPAETRLNILLVTALFATAILINPFTNAISDAKEYYREINEERVHLCFGHNQENEYNRALVKVEFVNRYGESDRQYSMEQLEQEYTNFKKKSGSWSNLWQFCQDSIDIELKSQILDGSIDDRVLYDDYYRQLGGYYYPDKNVGAAYYDQIKDKLQDVIYYTVAVEDQLNMKGLTLRQVNDTVDLNEELPFYNDMEYETATKEQIIEACDAFAMHREPTDESKPDILYLDKLDFSLDVGLGKRFCDIEIIENNGYNISSIEWAQEVALDSYAFYGNDEELEPGKKYRVLITVDVPFTMDIAEEVKVSYDGMEEATVNIERYTVRDDAIVVELLFVASEANGLVCKGLGFNLCPIEPGDVVAECEAGDASRLCDGEYIGWLVYDVETGSAKEYTRETFSLDNKCYIAMVEITPDTSNDFSQVEEIHWGYREFKEYDEELHGYVAGEYPEAYYVKYLDEDEDRIVAYIPYFMVYGTGVDGDIWITYSDQNYAYLPSGAKVKFRDRPKTDYTAYEYKVTDFEGIEVDVAGNIMEDKYFTMPKQPIILTGYFEYKY